MMKHWITMIGIFVISMGAGTVPVEVAAQNICGESETVVYGDTLRAIALRCNTSVEAIVAANPGLSNPDRISIGQQLTMPDPPAETDPSRGYVVQPGDTLYRIAQQFDTTVATLLDMNPQLSNPDFIYVGQQLQLMKYTDPLYPEHYYHLYNHAVGRDNFFNNDDNYRYFLKKYTQYIYPICRTYAYCLLPNHFHFLVQIRSENVLFDHAQTLHPAKELVQANFPYARFAMQQFSNFFNGYTKAYNKMYQRRGALFMDYLRRKRVENERYFLRLSIISITTRFTTNFVESRSNGLILLIRPC